MFPRRYAGGEQVAEQQVRQGADGPYALVNS